MNTCAPRAGESASSPAASLPLRHAQRAFAGLIAAYGPIHAQRSTGDFHGAQLRSRARRTLSVLSADDRARLMEWVSLQLAASDARVSVNLSTLLAHVDVRLFAQVRRALPERIRSLAMRAAADHIVAA
jgi:hypothetical protein